MGFFKKITGAIGGIAAPVAAAASVPVLGSAMLAKAGLNKLAGTGGDVGGSGPGIPDAARAQREKIVQTATDYRTNLGRTQAGLMDVQTDKARRGLAENIAGVRQAANRRGMLYSGLRSGAESEAAGKYASGLSAQRAKIGEETEAKANKLEDLAIEAALQEQQARGKLSDIDYKRALEQRKARNDMMGAVGGAAGGLIGTMAGK